MKRLLKILITTLTVAYGAAQTNITQVEYFIDTDLGVGLNTIVNITDGTDITETVTSNIPSSISVGYHKLYFRTKDANNVWSQTTRKNIEIVKPEAQNDVLIGEYFLDADPTSDFGVSFEINPNTTDITQDFLAQIPSNISLGYHKLYGRVKDSYSNWSFTFRKNIQVVENPNLNIVEIEYFFGSDNEFGNNTIVAINTPDADGIWNFQVPYITGNYNFNDVLYIRAKDSNQKWSQTTILDEIDTSLNVDRLDESISLKIHPNPVKDQVNISSSLNFKIEKISIYDLMGKKVFFSIENLRTLNMSHLNSGVYILSLKTNIGASNFKILKQ